MASGESSTAAPAEFRLAALPTPSGFDTSTSVPVSQSVFSVGSSIFLEIWVQTTDPNGLSSASLDLSFDAGLVEAVGITPSDVFSELVRGTIDNVGGVVDDLSGSHLGPCADGVAVAPNWARLAVVEFSGETVGLLEMAGSPTSSQVYGTAICGMGDIDPGTIIYDSAIVSLGDATVPSPLPDPSGYSKSRFVSFVVPAPQTAMLQGETALRVRLVALHHVDPPYTAGTSAPFTLFEGELQYVGPPVQYLESTSSGIPFYASKLQCGPHYEDWSTMGLLHVTGEAIVPSSTYEVENLAASCAGQEASCAAVSAPLAIPTTRWGDVAEPFNPPSTTVQPDTTDISSLVNKFKSAVGAPIKARALLAGQNSRGDVNLVPDLGFTHISACVDAFKGLPYPYRPGKCVGNESKACATESDCTAQGAAGPCTLCP